jgi:hypothetical protein
MPETSAPAKPCPLCDSENSTDYWHDHRRDYLLCGTCHLVFVPQDQLVSAAEEKARYDTHRNSPDDPRYRQFLSRLFTPVEQRLPPRSRGLDFGSGPGPTLSVMFAEAGHTVAIYDRFYASDPSVLEHPYTFITATEVVEHLRHPGQELGRLWTLLEPGGYLGLMTQLVLGRVQFGRWRYKDDVTHTRFFSRATFEWLGGSWKADVRFEDKDVIIFEKAGI